MSRRIFEVTEPGFKIVVEMDDGYLMYGNMDDERASISRLAKGLREHIFQYVDHPWETMTTRPDGSPLPPRMPGVSYIESCQHCPSPRWKHPKPAVEDTP